MKVVHNVLCGWVLLCVASGVLAQVATAADCSKVRFSDVGWSDITATTALAQVILEDLGYQTHSTQLSVPVTFRSLENKDIDVFLGNWMPAMAADIAPYEKRKSVDVVGNILNDAHYTLAVPDYVYEAGVHSVSDLARFADQFKTQIYGIEAGNDGNRLVQKMMKDRVFGPKRWKLIESSEQAMLMEVMRAVRFKKWVAFLAWEPHPMNTKIKLKYLTGADDYFGVDQGKSIVRINTWQGYTQSCPNVGRFLKQLTLSIDDENQMMGMILNDRLKPRDAARKWMSAHAPELKKILSGVNTFAGGPGVAKVIGVQKRG